MLIRQSATCLIAISVLFATGEAVADCAADTTVAEARQAHALGQQREQAGDSVGALAAYVAAQAYTCDANPVAADAARRSAALAGPLGDAARIRGDHAAAFDLYERGGHFAAADRELLARIQASPDDASLYALALRHARYRALPAFQSNEALRISITGAYRLDPQLTAAIDAMPDKAAERALAAESAAFDEAWYARYMALIQERPENPADIAALQRYAAKREAFHAAQPQDPLRAPLQALGRLQSWETQVPDQVLAATLAARRAARAEERALALARKYADAPELLQLAIDYLAHSADEHGARVQRMQRLRGQAGELGDAALAQQRYQLAIDYYRVAGADARAEQARARQQAAAQAQLQPGIAAMQRDAEALRAQFSDPQQIAEMQRRAQELQRALQSGKRSTDE